MAPMRRSAKALTPVDLQILLTLATGPLHGYGIKLDIARRTEGEMSLGSGTLYEAIQRLERRAFIAQAPAPDGPEVDPRRRYYRLEPAGERAMREELEPLAAVVRYGRALDLLLESGEG
jgi:DNA-binding PadR family transcriptional regulator